jgi:hypothetical protein
MPRNASEVSEKYSHALMVAITSTKARGGKKLK